MRKPNPTKKNLVRAYAALALAFAIFNLSGCAAMRSLFATDVRKDRRLVIENPFGTYYSNADPAARKNIVLRTKKGDRSVEVEIPGAASDMTDFSIPVSPHFQDDSKPRAQVSGETGIDSSYLDRKPTAADREIASTLPRSRIEDENTRRDVESDLGVTSNDQEAPDRPQSYLAAMDKIKQLYRAGRNEAALIEVESLIPAYQTDVRLYKMRGTLLDRLGHTQLAIQSWQQALRLEPENKSLQLLIDRKRRFQAGGIQ